MTSLAKWGDIGSWTSALNASTDLDSKTTGTAIAAGAVVTNGTSKNLFMDLSLLLGSINPTGNPYFEVHLLPLAHDGTSYADRSPGTYVGSIPVTTGSTAKVSPLTAIRIPPGSYKVQTVNVTGQTTAASGNSFQYRLYGYDLNG